MEGVGCGGVGFDLIIKGCIGSSCFESGRPVAWKMAEPALSLSCIKVKFRDYHGIELGASLSNNLPMLTMT